MDQQDTATTTQVSMKRKAATKLWVYYKDLNSDDRNTALMPFDYKSELDAWLATNSVQVLEIIRGTRKQWTAQTRVTLT